MENLLCAGRLTVKRNGEIELLRIILAVMVVFTHTEHLVGIPLCKFGFLAVDAFFILSGYLMMNHAKSENSLDALPFLWRRIRSFLPESFLAMLMGCVVVFYATGCGLRIMGSVAFLSLLNDVFLLRMTGLMPLRGDVNTVTWYLSSLVIGMAILYPFLRRRGVPLYLPVISLLLLGYILQEEATFGVAFDRMGFTYQGNIRALAELSLGAFACTVVPWLSGVACRRFVRIGLSILQYGLLLFAVYIAWAGDTMYEQAYFIVFMWLFIVMSFAGMGLHLQHPVFLFVGKISLPLFLCHRFWSLHLVHLLPGGMPMPALSALYFLISLISALFLLPAASCFRKALYMCFKVK